MLKAQSTLVALSLSRGLVAQTHHQARQVLWRDLVRCGLEDAFDVRNLHQQVISRVAHRPGRDRKPRALRASSAGVMLRNSRERYHCRPMSSPGRSCPWEKP